MGLRNVVRKDEVQVKEKVESGDGKAEMFRKYQVKLQFRNRVYGGLPKHPSIVETYIKAKYGEENGDLAEKIKSEVDMVEEEEKISCGFKRNSEGLHLNDYQVKAMLREAGTMLKITMKKRGSKQVFQHGIFVKPPAITLGTLTPHGTEDFTGHVMTMRGKRSILKKADYVEKPLVTFELWLLRDHVLNGDDLKECFTLGQELGMGSCRSFETGKFDLVAFEELS